MFTCRHGGHVGGINKETAAMLEECNILLGLNSIFMKIPPFVSLCKYGSGHMSEHTLYFSFRIPYVVKCSYDKNEENSHQKDPV